MNKMRDSVRNKLIVKDVTNAELNFIMYLCTHQDSAGNVMGVYYADFMLYAGMSCETFYNVLESLKKKEIILYTRTLKGDYNVNIVDNDFSSNNYGGENGIKYLSLRKKFFREQMFQELKVKEKLLVMDLLYICQSNHGKYKIGVDKCQQHYMELFHVTKRTIRRYLKSVKNFFDITREQGIYTIVPKKFLNETIDDSDEKCLNKYLVKTMARWHKIRRPEEGEIKETAELVNQYKEYAKVAKYNIWSLLQDCIEQSLEIINQCKKPREKKEYSLKYKLIHKLIRQRLKLA